jgi:hypothetical protein
MRMLTASSGIKSIHSGSVSTYMAVGIQDYFRDVFDSKQSSHLTLMHMLAKGPYECICPQPCVHSQDMCIFRR